MPAVFVHGVPEVPAVWAPLLSRLSRKDVVALRLPGFGGPRPDGFDATKESYVDWLVAAVEEVRADGPVDLVGHDWGAGFAGRLVSTRPISSGPGSPTPPAWATPSSRGTTSRSPSKPRARARS